MIYRKLFSYILALTVGFCQLTFGHEKPLDGYGVLLMHGTGANPSLLYYKISGDLEEQGALVVRPFMPWTGQRGIPYGYKKSVPDVLNDIEKYISEMKAHGAKKIVLMGHSIGAPFALAYGADGREPLTALVLLAPGQVPDLIRKRAEANPPISNAKLIMEHVEKSKQLVSQGKGDEMISFPFINQGIVGWTNSTPSIYLTYWDPDGPIVMPKNAEKLPKNLPVLYVIGDKDPLYREGREYFFNKLGNNPKNTYLEIIADHSSTPDVSAKQVVDWLIDLEKSNIE